MKNGDYFSWRWSDDEKHSQGQPWGTYHCKSRRAIFRDGFMYDTFWGDSPTDNSLLNMDSVDLEYLGNLDNMEVIRRGDMIYFRHEDYIDTSHSNNSNAPVYLKSGATKNRQVMLAHVQGLLNDSKREFSYQLGHMVELKKQIKEIECAEVLNEIYIG